MAKLERLCELNRTREKEAIQDRTQLYEELEDLKQELKALDTKIEKTVADRADEEITATELYDKLNEMIDRHATTEELIEIFKKFL